MDDFVAFPSRWRIALLVLGSGIFVLGGLWMVGTFGPPPAGRRLSPEMVTVVGWLCIAFFGLCGAVAIKQLFDSGEQLRINTSGIRWVRWSDQTIPWSEIADITIWQFQRQKSLVLHLRDAARFPGRGLQAMLAGANRSMTGGDIAVSLVGTDRKFDEMLAAVSRFRV